MNGFRITILVLLTLAVAVLLCMVTVFQSSQREAYEAYLKTVRTAERQKMIADHQDKMARIGVQEENDSELEALIAAQKKQDEEVTQQEERNVLASAERKDAGRKEEESNEVNEPQPLGLVASCNADWGFIMVKPVSDEPMPRGMLVAIRRAGNIVCEAELGERDEDGQINATIRQNQFTQQGDAAKFTPAVGDEVILSPYMSSSDLRAAAGSGLLPEATPLPQLPGNAQPAPQPEGLQEVDAELIPMP